MRRAALLALLLATTVAACGDGGDPVDTSHVLSGKIGGTDWTYVEGETNAFFSKDETFWGDLYDVPIDPKCFGMIPDAAKREIILVVPKAVGTYPLSTSLSQTFYVDDADGGKNYVATNGTVRVTELTATMLRGNATITYNSANTVSGTFEIPICP